MNFKEHLDFIKNAGENFYLGKALIATELECQVDFDLTADQFEQVCEYAYDYYLHSNASANEIIGGVLHFIKDSSNAEEAINSLWDNDERISDIVCLYC